MNVVAMKRPALPGAAKPKSKRVVRALRRQVYSAVGVGSIAVTLTALSLTHLAHGIEIVTSAPAWESYAMAIGIDLGFITAEFSQLLATNEKLRKQIARFTGPAIMGTLVGSAAMNAFAFASKAVGWPMIAAAVVLGVAIPALIYALTRIGAALYIDCHAKA
jgi:hypothetical protein